VIRSSTFPNTIGGGLSASQILQQDSVKVHTSHNIPPIVPLVHLPLVAPQALLKFPSHNLSNLIQGVAYRILRAKNDDGEYTKIIQPTVNIYSEYAQTVRAFVAHCPQVFSMTVDDYLLSCDKARRCRYQLVKEELYLDRISEPKQFVKLEPSDGLKKPPVCRIITDPGTIYNFEIGLFIKPAEHAVMQGFVNWVGYKVVMKGMNALEQGADIQEAWDSFTDPVSISGDAERFDAHTGVDIRRDLEFEVYKKLFPTENISKLMNRGLTRKVLAKANDGKFRYTLNSRGSGYHNTGIGNCLITGLTMMRYLNLNHIDAKLKLNGDDWFIICDRSSLPKFKGLKQFYRELGYRMEITKPVDYIEGIDFCQTSPVKTPNGTMMIRSPVRCRTRDLFTSKVRTEKKFRQWLASVAESGLATSSGIPVMQEFYTCIRKCSNGVKPGRFFDSYSNKFVLSKGLTYKRREVHPDTRYSFYLAFGYTPDEQIALEENYRTMGCYDFAHPDSFSKESLELADVTYPTRFSF